MVRREAMVRQYQQLYDKGSTYLLGQSLFFKIQRAAKQTTNLATINQRQLKAFQVITPPITEQRRIIAELDALQTKVDALRILQAETAAELNALLPAVLDRAFRGEL